MGSGIAEVCARAGLDVVVREVDAGAAEAGLARLTTSLDRGVRSGKLTEDARDTALGQIRVTTDLDDLADRQLVVEAVIEDEASKVDVFRALDEVVTDPGAILASNTSSIPIMKLASPPSRPEQVIGIHFFNPVPVLRLVELVTSLMTSPDTIAAADEFATTVLGKKVIRSQDRAGLRRQRPADPVHSCRRSGLMESGFATADDIDRHGRGLQPPDGPAAPRRPHRARHHPGRRPRASTRSSRSRCTHRRRCCRAWSRPGCSAARPAAASTTTRSADGGT